MSELIDEDIDNLIEKYTVFGRVTPNQKKLLIAAMQKKGHKVAMTGDSVNDLLAMRRADCSVAAGADSIWFAMPVTELAVAVYAAVVIKKVHKGIDVKKYGKPKGLPLYFYRI